MSYKLIGYPCTQVFKTTQKKLSTGHKLSFLIHISYGETEFIVWFRGLHHLVENIKESEN